MHTVFFSGDTWEVGITFSLMLLAPIWRHVGGGHNIFSIGISFHLEIRLRSKAPFEDILDEGGGILTIGFHMCLKWSSKFNNACLWVKYFEQ